MQFRRAHPMGELESPHFHLRIINERIKPTTFLTIFISLLIQHQSNSSIDYDSGI
jgi:hypothetical protein